MLPEIGYNTWNELILQFNQNHTMVPLSLNMYEHKGTLAEFIVPCVFHYFLQQYIKEILFRCTLRRFHDYVY